MNTSYYIRGRSYSYRVHHLNKLNAFKNYRPITFVKAVLFLKPVILSFFVLPFLCFNKYENRLKWRLLYIVNAQQSFKKGNMVVIS